MNQLEPSTKEDILTPKVSLIQFLMERFEKKEDEKDSENGEDSGSGDGQDSGSGDGQDLGSGDGSGSGDGEDTIKTRPIEGTSLIKIGKCAMFMQPYDSIRKKVLQYLKYTARTLDYAKLLNLENEHPINSKNLPKEVLEWVRSFLKGLDTEVIDTFYFIKNDETIIIFCGIAEDEEFMENIQKYLDKIEKDKIEDAFKVK